MESTIVLNQNFVVVFPFYLHLRSLPTGEVPDGTDMYEWRRSCHVWVQETVQEEDQPCHSGKFKIMSLRKRLETQWRPCALRHRFQNSMEAILACHPALSTEWLGWVAKWCERWRIFTGPILLLEVVRTIRSHVHWSEHNSVKLIFISQGELNKSAKHNTQKPHSRDLPLPLITPHSHSLT